MAKKAQAYSTLLLHIHEVCSVGNAIVALQEKEKQMIAITPEDAVQVVAMLKDLVPMASTHDAVEAVCATIDLLQELIDKEDNCVRR